MTTESAATESAATESAEDESYYVRSRGRVTGPFEAARIGLQQLEGVAVVDGYRGGDAAG